MGFKFKVGDMLQYNDGVENHLCIVVKFDEQVKKNKQVGFVQVDWLSEKSKRVLTTVLSFTAFDFSYGGWKKLS